MAKVVDDQTKTQVLPEDVTKFWSIMHLRQHVIGFSRQDQPSGYTEPLLHLNRLIKKINLLKGILLKA